MSRLENRIEKAANEVAEALKGLALEVSIDKEGYEEVTQLIGQIGKTFKEAAPGSEDTFGNLDNDVKALFPSRRRLVKARRRKEWAARREILQASSTDTDYEEHRRRTGYSHWRDCTMLTTMSEEKLFQQEEQRKKNAAKQRVIKYGDEGCPIVLTDSQ